MAAPSGSIVPRLGSLDDHVDDPSVELRLGEYADAFQLPHPVADIRDPLHARRALRVDRDRARGGKAEPVLEIAVGVMQHDERFVPDRGERGVDPRLCYRDRNSPRRV